MASKVTQKKEGYIFILSKYKSWYSWGFSLIEKKQNIFVMSKLFQTIYHDLQWRSSSRTNLKFMQGENLPPLCKVQNKTKHASSKTCISPYQKLGDRNFICNQCLHLKAETSSWGFIPTWFLHYSSILTIKSRTTHPNKFSTFGMIMDLFFPSTKIFRTQ